MITIEDDLHAEEIGHFSSIDEALAELKRVAAIAWDEPPNRAPCMSWKTCRREWDIVEFVEGTPSPNELRRLKILQVSAAGAKWLEHEKC